MFVLQSVNYAFVSIVTETPQHFSRHALPETALLLILACLPDRLGACSICLSKKAREKKIGFEII